MVLATMTWPDVANASRDAVVVIPTGALEQHGPHLPLMTDTILVTAVAEEAERRLPGQVLLTPALWLGTSEAHLPFAGTLSASFAGYGAALAAVFESLLGHGFHRFFLLNGHGGNTAPNAVALRQLKARHPEATLGAAAYPEFAASTIAQTLAGPAKTILHACEAETSLMLHVAPHLVHMEKARDDGLYPDPPVLGQVHGFDEISEEGPLGYASLATAEKGRSIFEACVGGLVENLRRLSKGYVLNAQPRG